MKKLYYGLGNKSIEVKVYTTINSRFQPENVYKTSNGVVMFRARIDSKAYTSPNNYEQHPSWCMPIIPKASVVSPDVCSKGYSYHDFDIVVL